MFYPKNSKRGASRTFNSSLLTPRSSLLPIKNMQLRNLTIPYAQPAVFAPMAGFTDAACRHLMADHGAAWTVSEMASAKAITFGDDKSVRLLRDKAPHGIYAVQLFGAEPETMAQAIRIIQEKGVQFDILALVGSLITPIFKPLGFGDWRISTALITGFTAKESVVSTLTVLLGGDTGALNMLFTPFTALVFLIFTLLYTPCVAAIAAVKRELGGGRAALGVVLMQCAIAWVVAFAVHCVGVLLGLA